MSGIESIDIQSGAATAGTGTAGTGTTNPAYVPTHTPRQVRWIVAVLMVGTFVAVLDNLVVLTALPTVVGELGGGSSGGWLITAYLLTSTIGVPLYGKLSDLIGRLRLYELALVIFMVASALAGFSQGVMQLNLARALQGVGAAGLQVLPMAIVADVAAPRDRARYQGVMAVNFAIASVLGPLVGGLFVDHLSWRWLFFMNVPLCIVAVLAAHWLPIKDRALGVVSRVNIDYLGFILLSIGATSFLLAITWSDGYRWGSPDIIGLLVLTGVSIGLLVVQERRAAEPIIPPEMFRQRDVVLIISSTMLLGVTMFATWMLMPMFFQIVTGASATQAGMWLLPFVFGNTAMTMITGWIVARTGRYKWAPVTGSLIATGGFALYTTMGPQTSAVVGSAYMFVTGLGLGMFQQVVVVMIQNRATDHNMGAATATIGFLRSLGFSLGSALGFSLFVGASSREIDSLISPAMRASLSPEVLQGNPAALRELSRPVQDLLVRAFADGLRLAFIAVLPLAVAAVVVMCLVRDKHEAQLEVRTGELDAVDNSCDHRIDRPQRALDEHQRDPRADTK